MYSSSLLSNSLSILSVYTTHQDALPVTDVALPSCHCHQHADEQVSGPDDGDAVRGQSICRLDAGHLLNPGGRIAQVRKR